MKTLENNLLNKLLDAGSVVVKRIQAADLPSVLIIEGRCSLSRWSEKDYLRAFEDAEYICLAAEAEAQIIGFLIGRLIISINSAEIYNIGVLPEFRRVNAGGKLITQVIEICRERGANSVFLEVRESNSVAQSFYANFGFQIVGKRKSFYRNPPETGFLLRLNLS